MYKRSFYFWVLVLVLLGPSVGFLAAGLLYGSVSGRAEAIGQTLQSVASWVRFCTGLRRWTQTSQHWRSVGSGCLRPASVMVAGLMQHPGAASRS